MSERAGFDLRSVDELTIDDETSVRHVGLYASLKDVLRDAGYRFRLLPSASAGRWDRALFLNLTFWGAADGGDVLVDDHLPADVVAHVAWHHLAAGALAAFPGAALSAEALFLGESIASAFDLCLVGRLLGHAPRSTFLASQLPAMAERAEEAGLSAKGFSKLVEGVAADPERAFEDLRSLLFDASVALLGCTRVDDALELMAGFDRHRFGPLIHHYELSNWVLYARAHASSALGVDARVRGVDRALREAPVSLEWLEREWVRKT